MLTGKWQTPWHIADMIQQIQEYMQHTEHIFQHILREGNQLANTLANRALDKGDATFTSFTTLDREIRVIINSNKLQSPYILVSPLRG